MLNNSIKLELKDHGKNLNDISGTVNVTYTGKYDGVVINALVIGSNSLVSFTRYNTKNANNSKSRLFIPSTDMIKSKIEFVASIEPILNSAHEIRLRVSIIQQHKEIESDLVFSTRG